MGARLMEDEPGTFATMLETSLDFFFLTPILFTKEDGKPMFEPREKDKVRLSISVRLDDIVQGLSFLLPASLHSSSTSPFT